MNENMSFKELYAIVRHRFVLILLITIGVTLITGVVQFKVISPTYQASTQVLVHESDGEENSNLSDIQRNLQYSSTFQSIMKSTALMEEVKAELHLSESASSLKGKVITSSENESEIITVAVQDHDPAKAAEIANTLVNKFEKEVDERMNVQGIHILSEAKASESPMIKPARLRNMVMAFGAAVMGGITLAFFLHFLDDSCKSARQLSERTGLPCLGSVPDVQKGRNRGIKHFGE
ncbi:YveK family protein [Bacillus inaquosorum]|uniref:YveK family protein n=1 Tax=Bacillus inaquosorum TaxID=483913 RepID=UPI002281D3E2|nr:YveK family protein [Bacillus inaquosorum]MCY8072061.1 Wzz/FepE/Etk N-terminal domain-containing protein [Bacillus inaquosorum]MCY9377543.1 Wzz/FepE/Etk N-terminal domain-containing protein [Bacillus inaquosorum]MEC5229615.1 YveK family protein [Bacillus inaquosorum]MED1195356.1 YveK family protein [Bacillus inaquosorum]MED1223447.1 YveK family protein [Bacillus inaquosorum]